MISVMLYQITNLRDNRPILIDVALQLLYIITGIRSLSVALLRNFVPRLVIKKLHIRIMDA